MYRINVVDAIRSLCAGKSDGVDDICSDNIKHATNIFMNFIVSLFNSILSHGCVPISFLSSTIIPILKIPDWVLKTQKTPELLHLVVCLAMFWIQLLLRSKLNSLAHQNYKLATKLKALL